MKLSEKSLYFDRFSLSSRPEDAKKSRPTPRTLFKKVGNLARFLRLFGPRFPAVPQDSAFVARKAHREMLSLSLSELEEVVEFLDEHGNCPKELYGRLKKLVASAGECSLEDEARQSVDGVILPVVVSRNLFSFKH